MPHTPPDPDTGLFTLLLGDGRAPLAVVGLALALAGGFALFVAARGEFLPHDVAFLGMAPGELCAVNECRIVHFMIHDRVAFGGALVAIGTMYLWLTVGPLARGQRWAWELLAASGAVGFASFLAYLGYGYLDTWHGTATAALAPLFLVGLMTSRKRINWRANERRWWVRPAWFAAPHGRAGSVVLLGVAAGMFAGGVTIVTVGMTIVFVPEDVAFLGMGRAELHALNPRLVPLIAHDRAGFGGAVCCCGVLLAGVVWRGEVDRAGWQALALAGIAGFGTAVFVHPAIGYTDGWHLSPAIGGAGLFALGWWLARAG
ncbi:hypothetical protein [Frigoriglobus tundricola]|uniref:Uncharacterized protein n=1 Tax=Frigoriglobus tundricola TaxID=2774151 RepID=A0A6M5YY36_9BACT|nr:hypothetical protein [Frigoriglobus tundricola]QJW98326.1 hypothetical protein FTUN_5914 [Frigoriglobus tundricola]